MTYRVILTENAKANLREYYERAAEHAPEAAAAWFNRFHESLQTLAVQPERCAFAPENSLFEEEIRQFQFGKRIGTFRVLFSIVDKEVRVLHIRRAEMGDATHDDIKG